MPNYVYATYKNGVWRIGAQSSPVAHLPTPPAGTLAIEVGMITTVDHDKLRAALSIKNVNGIDAIVVDATALAPLGYVACPVCESSVHAHLAARKPLPPAVRDHLLGVYKTRDSVPLKSLHALGMSVAEIIKLPMMRKRAEAERARSESVLIEKKSLAAAERLSRTIREIKR